MDVSREAVFSKPLWLIRLVAKINCMRGRHRYVPAYSVRQWVNSQRRHIRQEVQYECSCCGKPTKWIRLSRHAEFLAKHKPCWSKGAM